MTAAPTRHGPVSYVLESRLSDGIVSVSITLPPGGAGDVRLRLRVPATHVLTSVEVDGQPWFDVDVATASIRLPERSGRIDLLARFATAPAWPALSSGSPAVAVDEGAAPPARPGSGSARSWPAG